MSKNNTDKVFARNLFSNFSSSISFDARLYFEDIELSISYSKALQKAGVLTEAELNQIQNGLNNIKNDIEKGNFDWKDDLEDVHMNIESKLHDLIGDVAGKVHSGKSRNDQVTTSTRMHLKKTSDHICSLIHNLQIEIVKKAEENILIRMPSYTHLQRAQPILLSHHLMAYFEMLERDLSRILDCKERMDELILGSGAVAGTSFNIDRDFLAKELGFSRINRNSIDGVSDRDFVLEFIACLSTSMIHLSRLSEDMILWSSDEFQFVELSDNVVTTSSMMPQKRNPDFAELIRGKFGRVIGSLVSVYTIMKALPLSYNRDMQEDKEPLFDCIDTFTSSCEAMTEIIKGAKFNKSSLESALKGNLLATDLADCLAINGVPFREAHIIVSNLTKTLSSEGKTLSELSTDELNSLLDSDVDVELDIDISINNRDKIGGTSSRMVREEIKRAKNKLKI